MFIFPKSELSARKIWAIITDEKQNDESANVCIRQLNDIVTCARTLLD
jgi:hypothetical protein